MHNIGIIVNTTKDKKLEITNSIVKWLESRGQKIMLSEDVSDRLGMTQYGCAMKDMYKNADIIIVLGGDGTILGVARDVGKYETPLLGVNLGHLGFLTEVEIKDIFKSLEVVLSGGIIIEKRFMLQAVVYEDGAPNDFYALNDVAITRGTLSRIVTLKTYINEDYVTTIIGDGLIIATPTGSTGYSMSAGGPIVSPNVSVMILTPICPHSFFTRSIVVSDMEIVRIEMTENHGDAFLTMDGQKGYKIEQNQKVIIKKAPFVTNLIKLPDRSFYDVLRTKLTER